MIGPSQIIRSETLSLTNSALDPDLNGIQAEPLVVADYSGTGPNSYTVKGYSAERNGARGLGFFDADMRFGYRLSLPNRRRIEIAADVFNLLPHQFATPNGTRRRPNSCC